MASERRFSAKSGNVGRTFILARPTPGNHGHDLPRVNLLRALLGDEAVRFIYVVPGGDWERDMARLAKLFPEAEVKFSYPPFDEH